MGSRGSADGILRRGEQDAPRSAGTRPRAADRKLNFNGPCNSGVLVPTHVQTVECGGGRRVSFAHRDKLKHVLPRGKRPQKPGRHPKRLCVERQFTVHRLGEQVDTE
jgi:hypothetical protein